MRDKGMTQLAIFATLADKLTNEEIRDRFTPKGKGSRTSLKTWMTNRKDLSFDSLSAYHRDKGWGLPFAPANRQIEEIKSNHMRWNTGSRLDFEGKCLYSDDKLWIGVKDNWFFSFSVRD